MSNKIKIGIPVPDSLKIFLHKHLSDAIETYRFFNWEPFENINIGIKSIDNVSEEKIDDIIDVIKSIKRSDFMATVTSFGFKRRKKEERVLWANVISNLNILEVYNHVENGLAKLGFEREKIFYVPHIKLLQIKPFLQFPFVKEVEEIEFQPYNIVCESLAVYKSELRNNEIHFVELSKQNFNKE